MKINLKVIIVLIVLIIISAIFPVMYHYRDKTIKSIPDHVDYNKAVHDSLTTLIILNAGNNRCTGHIIPVRNIRGENISLKYLINDINLALAAYENWKLLTDAQTRKEIKERSEERFKKWGGMMDGKQLMNRMELEKDAEPDYVAKAQTSRLDGKINDIKVVVNVISEVTGTEVFAVSVIFTHPESLKKIIANLNEQKNKLTTLRKTADVSLKILYILVAILALYILIIAVVSVYMKFQIGKTKKYLLSEIQKKDNLVNEGHFVTALELSDKYLKYFPHDTEINAFRERLLDFTNNDPKKAQEAYVRAKKLQMRLKTQAQDFNKLFLSEEEKNDLTPLLPYNTELEAYYKKLVTLEDQETKRIEFRPKINEVRELIDQGMLQKAKVYIGDLLRDFPGDEELRELSTLIAEKQEYYENQFKEVEQKLKGGRIASAMGQLEEILQNYRDMKTAIQLKENVESNKGHTHVKLKTEQDDVSLDIFLKHEVMIGRDDIDVVPDIKLDDKRISRPHLRISVVDDNVIVEDQNSTGGTFINAEKIISEKLKHGDVITLSKIIDFTIQIIKDDDKIGSVILSCGQGHYLMIVDKIKGSIKNRKFDTNTEELSIYNSNGLCVIVAQNNYYIVSPNQEIAIQNKKYTVEVIS